MANCVNCGKPLSVFNSEQPLWSGTSACLCKSCRSSFFDFMYTIGRSQKEISREDIEDNQGLLKGQGFSPAGIKYLIDFAASQEGSPHVLQASEKRKIAYVEQTPQDYAAKRLEIEWAERKAREANRRDFMETTGISFEGYKIVEYLGICSGEVLLGTGLLSDVSAILSDFTGKKSELMAKKITQAKEDALNKLKDNCIIVKANAVIGVDLDISIISQNMILACANGTAVRIEKI